METQVIDRILFDLGGVLPTQSYTGSISYTNSILRILQQYRCTGITDVTTVCTALENYPAVGRRQISDGVFDFFRGYKPEEIVDLLIRTPDLREPKTPDQRGPDVEK